MVPGSPQTTTYTNALIWTIGHIENGNTWLKFMNAWRQMKTSAIACLFCGKYIYRRCNNHIRIKNIRIASSKIIAVILFDKSRTTITIFANITDHSCKCYCGVIHCRVWQWTQYSNVFGQVTKDTAVRIVSIFCPGVVQYIGCSFYELRSMHSVTCCVNYCSWQDSYHYNQSNPSRHGSI